MAPPGPTDGPEFGPPKAAAKAAQSSHGHTGHTRPSESPLDEEPEVPRARGAGVPGRAAWAGPASRVQPPATPTPRQLRAATLEALGHSTDEIASTLGIHRATVFRWRQVPGYRSAVASVVEDARRVARGRLEVAAHLAVRRLLGLVDSPDERVALRAAVAVLDRTGHGPTQRLDLTAPQASGPVREDPVDELRRALARVGLS